MWCRSHLALGPSAVQSARRRDECDLRACHRRSTRRVRDRRRHPIASSHKINTIVQSRPGTWYIPGTGTRIYMYRYSYLHPTLRSAPYSCRLGVCGEQQLQRSDSTALALHAGRVSCCAESSTTLSAGNPAGGTGETVSMLACCSESALSLTGVKLSQATTNVAAHNRPHTKKAKCTSRKGSTEPLVSDHA